MSEEHKIYVPLRGKHVQPAPYDFTARRYEEQGRPIKPDRKWRLGKYEFALLWAGFRNGYGFGFTQYLTRRHLKLGFICVCWGKR